MPERRDNLLERLVKTAALLGGLENLQKVQGDLKDSPLVALCAV